MLRVLFLVLATLALVPSTSPFTPSVCTPAFLSPHSPVVPHSPAIPSHSALHLSPLDILPSLVPVVELAVLALVVYPATVAGREKLEKLTAENELEKKMEAEIDEEMALQASRRAVSIVDKERKRQKALEKIEQRLIDQKVEEERIRVNQEEAVRLAEEKARIKAENEKPIGR